MRTFWKGILGFFFAAATLEASQEEKIQVDLSVDIWDDGEERDAFFTSREESLEKRIREKLRAGSFAGDSPIGSAHLAIDIHKQNEEILIDITGSKKTMGSEAPLFATELHYLIEAEDDDEEDDDDDEEEWWWITIDDRVLEQVEIFLNRFDSSQRV